MTRYYTRARARRSIAACTRSRSRRPICTRARAADRRLAGLDARGDDLHRQRHRRDQPRRLHLGPPERAARRPRGADRDGAPLEHRAVAAAVPGPRGRARVRAGATTTASSTSTRSTRCSRAGRSWSRVVHVSNVLGTINPVAEIARRAHDAGAVVADRRHAGRAAAARSTCEAIDADFYAWTGHKAYGPTGIGVLHGRRELLEEMPPFIGGGHMIRTVAANESHLDRPAVEVRGRHVADRRGDRARRRGRLDPGARDERDPRARAGAGRRTRCSGCAEVPGLTIHGPAERRRPRRAGLVLARGRPPARHRGDPRARRRVRARRPPLRPAADAPAGRGGHHARVVRGPQLRPRRGPADRGPDDGSRRTAARLSSGLACGRRQRRPPALLDPAPAPDRERDHPGDRRTARRSRSRALKSRPWSQLQNAPLQPELVRAAPGAARPCRSAARPITDRPVTVDVVVELAHRASRTPSRRRSS